jgi:hypothetical protein
MLPQTKHRSGNRKPSEGEVRGKGARCQEGEGARIGTKNLYGNAACPLPIRKG